MTQYENRSKSMVFDLGSTYLTDYQPYKIKDEIRTQYQPKPTFTKKRKPYRLTDTQTLSEYKNNVPYSLFIKPKDIVRTNPHIPPEPCDHLEDPGREEAQRTRPRLVLTPAVSMDDVEDTRSRQIICDDMYTSTWARESKDAVTPQLNVRAPMGNQPAPTNPVSLATYLPPLVPPEWRKDSVKWDGRQLRGYARGTDQFWMRRIKARSGQE